MFIDGTTIYFPQFHGGDLLFVFVDTAPLFSLFKPSTMLLFSGKREEI